MELVKKSRNPELLVKPSSEKVSSQEKEANHDFIKLVEEQLLISFLYEISGSQACSSKAYERFK